MSKPFKRKCDKGKKDTPWYFKYKDEQGGWRTKRGSRDLEETKRMAKHYEHNATMRREGLVNPKDDLFKVHEQRPLSEHLDDFQTMLLDKGNTLKHASVTKNRTVALLEMAGAERISQIVLSKIEGALSKLRAQGNGLETCNHYVRAVKAFSRWLHRDGRAREHVLAYLSTFNSATDKRRPRRPLTDEEARKVIAVAEAGRTVKRMSGTDRAMLYRLAMGSGFRAQELASLTPESFDFDSDPPTVTVKASYSKHRRMDVQPLPLELAALLREWMKGKAALKPVFAVPDRTAEMLRIDLKAAGIPYKDEQGRYADFHASGRKTFISNVVSSGASVKAAQTLARHSTPVLTIGLYAHTERRDVARRWTGYPTSRLPVRFLETIDRTATV